MATKPRGKASSKQPRAAPSMQHRIRFFGGMYSPHGMSSAAMARDLAATEGRERAIEVWGSTACDLAGVTPGLPNSSSSEVKATPARAWHEAEANNAAARQAIRYADRLEAAQPKRSVRPKFIEEMFA